jgi:cell division protein FtsB
VAAVALMAFLYYRPVRTYLDTRGRLDQRRGEVRDLRAQKRALERQLVASSSPEALVREARRLGYVKPGEHLYIVKGIDQWRRALRTTMRGDG